MEYWRAIETVNGKYYRVYIQKCLRPSIREKCPELLKAGPIILHENAAPHVSAGWRHFSASTVGKH